MAKRTRVLVPMAVLAMSSLLARAQMSPAVIPFQGQLASQSGEPLSPAQPVTLVFRLYENPVGGVALWEESQPNIVVIGGRFNVLLGSRTPFSDLKIFNRTIYLGITIDDGDPATVDVEMRPRQAIVPVISAILARNSDKLNGHDWSDLLVGGSNDPSNAKIRVDKVDLESVLDPGTFRIEGAKIKLKTSSIGNEVLSNGAVTSDKIAAKAITQDKVADHVIGADQRSELTIASTGIPQRLFGGDEARSWKEVASLKIITSGRPLLVGILPSTSKGQASDIEVQSHTGLQGTDHWQLAITRDGEDNVISSTELFSDKEKWIFEPITWFFIDTPSAGPHTYSLRIMWIGYPKTLAPASMGWLAFRNYNLEAFEL